MNSLWTLLRGLLFDSQGQVRDLYGVLDVCNDNLTSFVESFGLPTWALWAAGIVLALVVGFFGYRLIKLIMGVALAGIGYLIGVALFEHVNSLMEIDLPAWLVYIFGAGLAVIFLMLTIPKFSYALFIGAGVLGFGLTLFYVSNNYTLALGGAFLIAMLTVFAVRYVFILISSALGAVLTVNCLAMLLPGFGFLQLNNESKGIILVAVLTVIFFLVQIISTHKSAKAERAHRRRANRRRRRRRRAA